MLNIVDCVVPFFKSKAMMMEKMNEKRKAEWTHLAKIVSLCLVWYLVSSTTGVLGKKILEQFPYPMTMTMVQLSSIALLSPPLLSYLDVSRSYAKGGGAYSATTMLFLLAFGKFMASLMSHFSILKVQVSYTHTVKATMPIFTVILSRIILGTKYSYQVYMSLLPIVLGVALATLSEASFEFMGLFCALLATCGFALTAIYSRQLMKESGIHHMYLLFKLGQIAALMFLPIWALADGSRIYHNINWGICMLLVINGSLHWIQNVIAFSLYKLVTPLTYAVANVTKRIAVIIASLTLLQNPVTPLNMLGMVMAVGGVFIYGRTKNTTAITTSTKQISPSPTFPKG